MLAIPIHHLSLLFNAASYTEIMFGLFFCTQGLLVVKASKLKKFKIILMTNDYFLTSTDYI